MPVRCRCISLHMPVRGCVNALASACLGRIVLIRLTKMGKHTLHIGSTVSWAECWAGYKEERES